MIAAAGYAQAEQVRQEAGRRLIVRLVFIVFLLLIFEGALRKWVLPGLQRPLYFSCDPFVALIYACVLLNGLILRSRMLVVLGLFAVPVSVLYLLLAVFGIGHPIAWALGVHHYFFYIPLAFVIGRCFRFEDLAALIRLNLLLAIPIAVLVFVQYRSPPSAFVNRAIAHDLDKVTHVAGDILRPYGTFTSSSGHVLYTAVERHHARGAWLMRRADALALVAAPAGDRRDAGHGAHHRQPRRSGFSTRPNGSLPGRGRPLAPGVPPQLAELGFILLVALGTVILYSQRAGAGLPCDARSRGGRPTRSEVFRPGTP